MSVYDILSGCILESDIKVGGHSNIHIQNEHTFLCHLLNLLSSIDDRYEIIRANGYHGIKQLEEKQTGAMYIIYNKERNKAIRPILC